MFRRFSSSSLAMATATTTAMAEAEVLGQSSYTFHGVKTGQATMTVTFPSVLVSDTDEAEELDELLNKQTLKK